MGGPCSTTSPLPIPAPPTCPRSGRFLRWVGSQQKGILALGVLWGVLWMGSQALIPGALGAGVQAIPDKDLPLAYRGHSSCSALGLSQAAPGLLRHRLAVTNWITAGARVQQLIVRRASDLGADLPKQVATGEVVAATANDVERIGNAFDILPRFIGAIVAFFAVAIILVASNLDARPHRAHRRPAADPFRRAAGTSPRTSRTRPARPPRRDPRAGRRHRRRACGCCAASAAKTSSLTGFAPHRQNVQKAAVRTAAVHSLLDALQVFLPGIFVVIVTWIGARLAFQGELNIGQLVAFYGYTAFLVLPLRTVTEAAHKWTAARVATATRPRCAHPRPHSLMNPAKIVSEPGDGRLHRPGLRSCRRAGHVHRGRHRRPD